ncbi:MAG: VWA domain-containing protein [Acidobacteriota bacterium]|nr:VWA domain-containing protein [Acidobacteriota bacterium]
MKRFFCALSLCFTLNAISIFAQTPSPTPPQEKKEDVVVITTNLIQIDATVTDDKGNVVTDLTADDFEIFENGEKQTITNFSFINIQPQKPAAAPPKNVAKDAPPAPVVPNNLRSGEVQRTIALVVDDLGLSFASVVFVRDALRNFVDKQMQPGDLVAIIRTGSGIGALQQFTSDKRLLYAAIEKVKFNMSGRVGISSFRPLEPALKDQLSGATFRDPFEGSGIKWAEGRLEERAAGDAVEQFREDTFTVGTLGAMNYIVKGMRTLPGRKAMMLFSEGFPLMSTTPSGLRETNTRIFGALERLVEQANRASVIVYAVDPRGLEAPGLTASDNTIGLFHDQVDQMLRERSNRLFQTQQGLEYLAENTGGFAVINQNSIPRGIERMLKDQKGYYLIAYQPEDEAFDPAKRRFNKLTVKIKRPGLKVRYRSGFFGITDSEIAPRPKTPAEQILAALTSPFAGGDIDLRLTTLYAGQEKKEALMRAMLHVNGDDLKFVEDADGWQKAKFEILAVIFGDNGTIIEQINQTQSIKARDTGLREIREKGLVLSVGVPVKKTGAYQMRVALRDETSGQIGSAYQFIEVPNLKKSGLVLSGIVLESSTLAGKNAKNDVQVIQTKAQRDVAVRSFLAGSEVKFGVKIYNAKKTGVSLVSQFRIFRGDREIFASAENPLNLNAAGADEITVGGAFTIGRDMPPDNYVLQILLKDPTKKGSRQYASQWIDFEVAGAADFQNTKGVK